MYADEIVREVLPVLFNCELFHSNAIVVDVAVAAAAIAVIIIVVVVVVAAVAVVALGGGVCLEAATAALISAIESVVHDDVLFALVLFGDGLSVFDLRANEPHVKRFTLAVAAVAVNGVGGGVRVVAPPAALAVRLGDVVSE